MDKSRHPNFKDLPGWQTPNRLALRCLILLTLCFSGVSTRHHVLAQLKSAGAGASSLCNRNDALEMMRQQIDVTRTFDNSVRRITVLIRAADLLWPFQQDKARAAFTEAFELAGQNEKENEKERRDLWKKH